VHAYDRFEMCSFFRERCRGRARDAPVEGLGASIHASFETGRGFAGGDFADSSFFQGLDGYRGCRPIIVLAHDTNVGCRGRVRLCRL
jgi:hypothetical protein